MTDKDLNTSKLLDQIGKKEGYTLPENYFDTLPKKIYDQLHITTSVEEENVPEGYFDHLPEIVLERAKKSEVKQGKVVVMNVFKKYASVAAVIILLISAGLWLLNDHQTTTTDDWTYLEYLNENPSEIDLNTLLEYELINDEILQDMDISLIEETDMVGYLESNLDEIEINYLDELYE